MIHSKVTRIVGLKEAIFKDLITKNQILCSEVRLLPALKTGDEGALTSIFLSALRLVKEFRHSVFKDIKMPRSGRFYYLREVSVPELSKCIVDGLIVCIKSGKHTPKHYSKDSVLILLLILISQGCHGCSEYSTARPFFSFRSMTK